MNILSDTKYWWYNRSEQILANVKTIVEMKFSAIL